MEYEMVDRLLTDKFEKDKEREKLNHQHWVEAEGDFFNFKSYIYQKKISKI
jgi:hypothetical protein